MNILMCNSIHPLTWGGGERWYLSAAAELIKRGHRVLVAGREGSIFLDRVRRSGLPAAGIRIRLDYGLGSLRTIGRLLRRERIERVLLNVNKDARTFGVAARLAGIPLVACRHGARVFSDRLRDRLTCSFLHRVIVNNLPLAREYAAYGWISPDKIRYLPNGVACPANVPRVDLRARYDLPAGAPVLLGAGRFSPEKGFDLLLKAFAAPRVPAGAVLLLAGEGREKDRLRSLAAELGIAGRVRFIGYLDDLSGHLAGAELLVLPSRHEGMPNVVLEAMASGCPVAATRVGGVADLIEDGREGWLAEPGDPTALALAMAAALEDGRERARRAARARDKIRDHYSLGKMISGLEDALDLNG